jgi:hypothetical protein
VTPQEMREQCGNGFGSVSLRIPRMPTGEGIRLTPHSGPVGYVMCCRDGYTVARFSAAAILRWLDRQERSTSKEVS